MSLLTRSLFIKSGNLLKQTKPSILVKSGLSSKHSESSKKTNEMDNFKSNPYYSKYEDKLKTAYEQNPALFQNAFGTGIKDQKKDSDVKGSKMAYSLTKKRGLDSIMKTNMLDGHGKEEVKKIWTTYMNERSRISDILKNEDYEFLLKRSEKFKTFLLPLPRDKSGYEFIVCQWSNNECHLTPLINFQAYGENAPSAISLVFFDELVKERNLDMVLVMGEWDDKIIKREEAKRLWDQIKLFYLNRDESDEKFRLMTVFFEKPAEFKHMDLIKVWEEEKKKGFGELD